LILELQQKDTPNRYNPNNPNNPKPIHFNINIQRSGILELLGTPQQSQHSGGLPQFSIFKEKSRLQLHVLWGAKTP
jgi:hypothetical protein